MTEARLQRLDLQLIRVFLALLDEQSVTRAAARINITPSAVSHSLNQLRDVFDDPLFVRRATHMQPTARAGDMGPRLRAAMLNLEQAIMPSRFDPATQQRRFTLTMAPYMCRLLLPPVMRYFGAEAPRADMRIRPRSASLDEDFNKGDVDLAVVWGREVSDDFAHALLFADEWVWAIPRAHAPTMPALTLEALAAIPHLVISGHAEAMQAGAAPSESNRLHDGGALAAALGARGLTRRISLNVPDAMTALSVAAQCGHATMVPRRLAKPLAAFFKLALFAPPYDVAPIQAHLVWRHETGADPWLEWLRGLIGRAVGDLKPSTEDGP